MKGFVKRLAALLLCLVMLCSGQRAAFADDDYSVIDADELDELVQEFIESHDLNGSNISIGYCYIATGERWYYNQDEWYYAASMYKVPLMMLMSEKVKSGELTQESDIRGMSLEDAEELILVHSNNEWAHVMRNYLGGDSVWREQAMKYSSMAESDYDPDYMDYGYVNPRYMIDVFSTLYEDPDSYPNILDMLLLASPEHYLRRNLEGQYDIAQKYGALEEFHHITGIIYTPNPIIVTVMTQYTHAVDALVGDAAQMLVDYTLKLDERLEEQKKAAEAEPEPTPQPTPEPAVEETAPPEPELPQTETRGDSRTSDALAKVAAYIAVFCAVMAFVLAIAQGISNLRRKAQRRKQRAASRQRGRVGAKK